MKIPFFSKGTQQETPKFKPLTLEQLHEKYTNPKTARWGQGIHPEGNGYYLRKTGYDETGATYGPNLEIHVPYLGLPLEPNQKVVDLLQGFTCMPELNKLMNLCPERPANFFFCNDFHWRWEGNASGGVYYFTLCNPNESSHILIITPLPDTDKGKNHGQPIYKDNDAQYEVTYTKRGKSFIQRTAYELVPIGFRNMPEGEVQSPECRERLRWQIIAYANACLGIEDEEDNLSSDNTANIPENPETSEHSSANAASMTEHPPIPGLTPGTESITLWIDQDDMSISYRYVIDKFGRLLAPDKVIDCRHRFIDMEIAEFRTWTNLPEDALVLTIEKIGSEKFDFNVPICPDKLTSAQYERVEILESFINGLELAYGIGEGWGLWPHFDKPPKDLSEEPTDDSTNDF